MSPAKQKLFDLVRSEPEWAMPALLNFFERLEAGERGEALAKVWRAERAAAERAAAERSERARTAARARWAKRDLERLAGEAQS